MLPDIIVAHLYFKKSITMMVTRAKLPNEHDFTTQVSGIWVDHIWNRELEYPSNNMSTSDNGCVCALKNAKGQAEK